MLCLPLGVQMSFVKLCLLEMAEKAEFTGALLMVMWYLPQASSIPLFIMEVEENDCSLHETVFVF